MRENIRGDSCVRKISARAAVFAAIALGAIFLTGPAPLFAQDNPKYVIDEDCQAFDIAPDNSIVYAVPRIKGVKRLIIERDDIYVASGPGKSRKIVEADKFMPFPPPAGYVVNSLAWSPDGQRIAVNMTLQEPPPGWDVKKEKKKGELDESEVEPPLTGIGGGRAIALLDAEGHEIKVAGSKTRFIEGAGGGTWLADGKSVVYLTGGGPYTITRVNPIGRTDDGALRRAHVQYGHLGRQEKPRVRRGRQSEHSRATDARAARSAARDRHRGYAARKLPNRAELVSFGHEGRLLRGWRQD